MKQHNRIHLQVFLRGLRLAFNEFIFPSVCTCCGDALSERDRYLCDTCLTFRFDIARQTDPLLLPDCVRSSFALWNFDKGEVLQDLLHMIKYQNIPQAGIELGQELGRQWLASGNATPNLVQKVLTCKEPKTGIYKQMCLVPVPLHQSKFRKRGYNQAEKIALGVTEQTEIPLVKDHSVIKTRKSISQTGLQLKQREKNVRGSFEVKIPQEIGNKIVFIIDDVFTTGATTFELAYELDRAGAQEIHILTVAIA